MFCPYCGREFQERDSKYCPFCGQDLSSPDDPLIDKVRYSNIWKMRSVLLAGTIAIILMIAGIALVLTDSGSNDGTSHDIDHIPEDEVIVVDENSSITLGNDFSEDKLEAYLNIDKQLVIYLNSEIAEEYSHYTWVLRDDLSNTYFEKDKQEPEMIWPEPNVGTYTVLAYCYDEPSDTEPAEVYIGSISYKGDKTQHFSWIYDGRTYKMDSVIPLEDQNKYASPTVVSPDIRKGLDIDAASWFVVTDGAVGILEDQLSKSYERRYGATSPGDYGYASFLLSFVQSMGYSYDSMNHYQNNYWAFPAETLFNGCGDEEDMSFLYASLLKAAGYRCGLMYMPGTMMVAVDVEDAPQIVPPEDHREARFMLGNNQYLLCEPYSEADACLGAMKECYDVSRDGKTVYYYGTPYYGDYGFISVDS